jgi:hypothetical protein
LPNSTRCALPASLPLGVRGGGHRRPRDTTKLPRAEVFVRSRELPRPALPTLGRQCDPIEAAISKKWEAMFNRIVDFYAATDAVHANPADSGPEGGGHVGVNGTASVAWPRRRVDRRCSRAGNYSRVSALLSYTWQDCATVAKW